MTKTPFLKMRIVFKLYGFSGDCQAKRKKWKESCEKKPGRKEKRKKPGFDPGFLGIIFFFLLIPDTGTGPGRPGRGECR
jgi:hypothetical protein